MQRLVPSDLLQATTIHTHDTHHHHNNNHIYKDHLGAIRDGDGEEDRSRDSGAHRQMLDDLATQQTIGTVSCPHCLTKEVVLLGLNPTAFMCQGCGRALQTPTLHDVQRQQQPPRSTYVQPRDFISSLMQNRRERVVNRHALRSMMMEVDGDDELAPAPIIRQETSTVRGNAQTRVTHGELSKSSLSRPTTNIHPRSLQAQATSSASCWARSSRSTQSVSIALYLISRDWLASCSLTTRI